MRTNKKILRANIILIFISLLAFLSCTKDNETKDITKTETSKKRKGKFLKSISNEIPKSVSFKFKKASSNAGYQIVDNLMKTMLSKTSELALNLVALDTVTSGMSTDPSKINSDKSIVWDKVLIDRLGMLLPFKEDNPYITDKDPSKKIGHLLSPFRFKKSMDKNYYYNVELLQDNNIKLDVYWDTLGIKGKSIHNFPNQNTIRYFEYDDSKKLSRFFEKSQSSSKLPVATKINTVKDDKVYDGIIIYGVFEENNKVLQTMMVFAKETEGFCKVLTSGSSEPIYFLFEPNGNEIKDPTKLANYKTKVNNYFRQQNKKDVENLL